MSGKRTINIDKENETFPTKLRELMEVNKITQETLASYLGVKRQTVSLYKSGQSKPDVDQLYKIASFFGVSSDYLIGISPVQSTDTQVQQVCRFTGLSEKALEKLKKWGENDSHFLAFVNNSFENSEFWSLLSDVCEYKDSVIAEHLFYKLRDEYYQFPDGEPLTTAEDEKCDKALCQDIKDLSDSSDFPEEVCKKVWTCYYIWNRKPINQREDIEHFMDAWSHITLGGLDEYNANKRLVKMLDTIKRAAEAMAMDYIPSMPRQKIFPGAVNTEDAQKGLAE